VQGGAVGAQTFGVPPTPQAWPPGQLPQFNVPPQPSESPLPQLNPKLAQVFGTQLLGGVPQTLGEPAPPQICVPVAGIVSPLHVPQLIVPPHPSVMPPPQLYP
jgi:hypothetical protein